MSIQQFEANLQKTIKGLMFLLNDINEDGNRYNTPNFQETMRKILEFLDYVSLKKNQKGFVLFPEKANLLKDGKIRIILNTSNAYKKKSFENFFYLNFLGKHFKHLFHLECIASEKDVEESTYSMHLNSLLKAKQLHEELGEVGYCIGDDSGVISPLLSSVILYNNDFNTTDLKFPCVFPGVISKRIGDISIFVKIVKEIETLYRKRNDIYEGILVHRSVEYLDELKEQKEYGNFDIHTFNSLVLVYLLKIANLAIQDYREINKRVEFITHMSAVRTDVSINSNACVSGNIDLSPYPISKEINDITIDQIINNTRSIKELLYTLGLEIKGGHGYNKIFNMLDSGILHEATPFFISNSDHRAVATQRLLFEIFKDFYQ